jgi:hypothetical protein
MLMRFYINRHEGKNMNKATIGALAMVLVGSVTFSFTNALLTNHSTKKVQTHSTTNLGDQKLVDGTNQTDKTVTDSTPTQNGNDIQTTDSLTTSVNQAELSNENVSEQPIAVNQNNTLKISSPSPSSNTNASTITTTPKTNTPSTGTTSTKQTVSSAPTTNINTAPSTPTSNVPVTTTAQATSTATSPTTTTTNRGQQVAQAAKEKAASQQNKKVTN